jgi:mannose-6-phosphate isomerase
MLILRSIPKERIWGTQRLQAYSTEKTTQKIGSVYSASGIVEIDSPVDFSKN